MTPGARRLPAEKGRRFWRGSVMLAALQATTAFSQASLDQIQGLEEQRNRLFQQIAPGIVSVAVVHSSIPAWAMASIERCANECRLQPWRCGELSDEELDQWRGWCDSFLSHTEANLLRGTPSAAPERVADWKAFLTRNLEEWKATLAGFVGDNQKSLDQFLEVLSKHLGGLGDHLEKIHARALRPLTLRQGTGFVVSKGHVVTTMDVARIKSDFESLRIWSDAQVAYSTGEIVGTDPETNVALIRLASPGAELLPSVRLDPNRMAMPGDFVYAFWHAFSQPASMRTGEITGGLRKVPFFDCATFLETSLPTSPGTLGAPLVNLEGQLIGMGTVFMAQGSMSEITYALPAPQLLSVVDQIKNHGIVQRGKLGVMISEFQSDDRLGKKVVVQSVEPESTASRHGILPGDVIVAINDEVIHCRMHLQTCLSKYQPEQDLVLDLNRPAAGPVRVALQLDPLPPAISAR